jgi:hypothetical protein
MAIITGIHTLIYTKDPDGVRTFFRDILGFSSVDAGEGWLIFTLPPAELGIHPSDEDTHHEVYLMCDDIHATVAELKSKGVKFIDPVNDQGFGLKTSIQLPGGGVLGIYQPKHPTALPKDSLKK